MASLEYEKSDVVRAVRKAVDQKLAQNCYSETHYSLLDLVFGRFNQWSVETRQLSRSMFLADMFMGRYQVDVSCYEINLAGPEKRVGSLVWGVGHNDELLAGYGLARLTNGETFEFERPNDSKESQSLLQELLGGEKIDRTTIRHNGEVIGECRAVRHDKYLGGLYEWEWELLFKDRVFGRITRQDNVTWNNLFVTRDHGERLPVIPASHAGFKDVMIAWGYLLTLGPLRGKPWPNPDLIVPQRVRPHLAPDEIAFYVAITMLYRVYFGLDNPSSD